MKKYFILSFFMALYVSLSAQKKPSLTILPSNNWCYSHYYTVTYSNQGQKVTTPDYNAAFMQDPELSSVISKIGQILTTYGYTIKDAEREMNALLTRQGEDMSTMSKNTGATLAESDLDIIKRRTKCDILIQLNWHIVNNKTLDLTIEAFDAYTSNRIATSSASAPIKDASVVLTVEDALSNHIQPFLEQMDMFYSRIINTGREVILNIKKFDDSMYDLESEFHGEELLTIIEDWLHENTVGDEFNLIDATENFAQFEQVRIPVFDGDGRAFSARDFANQLRKYLRELGVDSKIMIRGLGEATLVVGDK